MSTNQDRILAYSPVIQSLIPLFYAAWADRVLSPSEVVILREKVQQLPFITKKDQDILRSWSNPAAPPTRDLFKFWEIQIYDITQRWSSERKASLVDIGLALANRAGSTSQNKHPEIDWSLTTIRKQLEELENLLGQISIETYRQIFPD